MRISVFLFHLLFVFSLLYADQEINTLCPVMPDEEVDKSIFTIYQGQKVYLCCKRCLKRFIENPELYAAKLPQFSHDIEADVQGNREHGNDHNTGIGFFHLVSKIHPISVHFPIALILTALFFDLLLWWKKKSIFQEMVKIMILIAAFTSVVSVILGWFAGAFANYLGELNYILQIHRWLGTLTAISIITTSIFSELYHRHHNNKYKVLYKLGLVLSSLLVVATGHFGGTLIYGLNYFG